MPIPHVFMNQLPDALLYSLFQKSGVSLLLKKENGSDFTAVCATDRFLYLTQTEDQILNNKPLLDLFPPESPINHLLGLNKVELKDAFFHQSKFTLEPYYLKAGNGQIGKFPESWWSVSYESIGHHQQVDDYVLVTLTDITAEVNNTASQVSGLVITENDIARDLAANELIKLHEAQLELIYNTIADVVFMLDVETGPNFKFASVNQSFLKSTGLTEQQVVGKYVEEVIPKESIDLVLSKYAEAIKEKLTITWEEESEYPAGIKIGQVTVTPLFDEGGECVRMIGSVHDITNQKNQESEIRKSHQDKERVIKDLLHRNKDLEQFNYIVSHNLRAPLANIIGLTGLFESLEPDPDLYKQIISGIARSGRAMDDVIKDLNYILQQKELNTEIKQQISIQELIESIRASIGDIISREKAEISLICNNIDTIYSTPSYLYSIFYNLIINSIKYRKAQLSPLMHIECHNLGDNIEIVFADNGKGMDMKRNGADLFGLYKRFDTTVKGKGLGLYLVKMQVESLGGKITAQGEVDKGMQFTILLPKN